MFFPTPKFLLVIAALFLVFAAGNAFAASDLWFFDFTLSSTNPTPGQTVTATLDVKNGGNSDTNVGFWVDLYRDQPTILPCDLPNGQSSANKGPLAPGEKTGNFQLSFTAPSTAGTYWSSAFADSDCDVNNESDEGNNQQWVQYTVAAACTPTSPTASTLSSPANGATGVSTSPTLSWNPPSSWGTGCPSNNNHYEVYLDTSSNPTTFKGWGTSTTFGITGLSQNTKYYWKIRARNGSMDKDSAVWSFTTASAAQPNLVVQNLTYSPASPAESNLMSFGAEVKNSGGASANSSITQFRVDGAPMGTGVTGAMAAGSTVSQNVLNIWTATAGSHTLKVCADETGNVAESSETDNCASVSFTVSAAAGNDPPQTPPQPAAELSGSEYFYYTYAPLDPNGDKVKVAIDWGDGTKSTSGLVDSGEKVGFYHRWPAPLAMGEQKQKFTLFNWQQLVKQAKELFIGRTQAAPPDIFEVVAQGIDEFENPSPFSLPLNVVMPDPATDTKITFNGYDNSGNPKINFRWTPGASTSFMTIDISDSGMCPVAGKVANGTFSWSKNSPIEINPPEVLCGGPQDATPQEGKTYWWRIASFSNAGYVFTAPSQEFTVPVHMPTGVQVSSACVAGKPKVDISWDPTPGALGYDIDISDNGSMFPSSNIDVGDLTSFSWSESNPLSDGRVPEEGRTYFARVAAQFPPDGHMWSEVKQFKVGGCIVAAGGAKCGMGLGYCSPDYLSPYFGANVTKASIVCNAESGGSATKISFSGDVGLFQINAATHKLSVAYLQNPDNNIKEAVRISSGGTNWRSWSVAYEYACVNGVKYPQCGFYPGKVPWHPDC